MYTTWQNYAHVFSIDNVTPPESFSSAQVYRCSLRSAVTSALPMAASLYDSVIGASLAARDASSAADWASAAAWAAAVCAAMRTSLVAVALFVVAS